MEAYNPFANNDVENIAVGPGPMIFRVCATDPDRKAGAVQYLEAHGYRFGWHDNGAGTMVQGWKFSLRS